ncbi:hypothetical protein RISK_000162 [Rhodopirellula islandica]|uniref:Uncharacterized protein n=1 Tax=Rhodopirellula islandica TaxID=595434 RepID=A0A0J1EQN0_RHOIS|nr:hypothetical protein RISK_000162 [Rhodopirellula islandica]
MRLRKKEMLSRHPNRNDDEQESSEGECEYQPSTANGTVGSAHIAEKIEVV